MVSQTQRLFGNNDSEPESRYRGVIALFVLVGLLLRFYLLAQPGHLFGITEYDDGVYFGAALRLIEGVVPYKDFVLVQPPGIAALLAPIAFIAKTVGTAYGLAIARILTIVIDGVNIVLVGLLVRWRGKIAVAAACAVMALYPAAIASSQTVLLEPFLNFFCLLGLYMCFRGSRFRSSNAALFFGGMLFGLAGSIKAWAIVPVIVVASLLFVASQPIAKNIRKLISFAIGVTFGFALLSGPFILLAPKAFFNQVIIAQLTRVPGQRVDFQARMREIAGAGPLVKLFGHADVVIAVLSLALLAVLVIASFRMLVERSNFTILVPVVTTAVFLALLWPSDFYYHYADFIAPYLAITIAIAVSAPWLKRLALRHDGLSRTGFLAAAVLASFWVIASFYYESAKSPAPQPAKLVEQLIPKGACVVTDEVSLTVAANRFFASNSNCPKMVDSYGTALALSGGKTIDGGASLDPRVISAWLIELERADYVWLSPQSYRRVPSARSVNTYFEAHFRVLAPLGSGLGKLYKRIG